MKKKLFCALAFFAACVPAFAQYQVGELYEKDGVPCVIIKVDETGEHGVAMSLTKSLLMEEARKELKYDQLDDETLRKKALSIYMKCYSLASKKFKAYVKEASSIVNEAASLLGADGKSNTLAIKQFCADKNIEMKKYFPAYAWADSLGEGWFIPGDNELGDYSYVIGCGLGKDLYPKDNKILEAKFKSLEELCLTTDGFQKAQFPMIVASSTMINDKKEAKIHILNKKFITGLQVYYFFDIDSFGFTTLLTQFPADCACCEF